MKQINQPEYIEPLECGTIRGGGVVGYRNAIYQVVVVAATDGTDYLLMATDRNTDHPGQLSIIRKTTAGPVRFPAAN